MIGHLRGTISHVALDRAVIEVGGIGLQVLCSPSTLAALRLGQEAIIVTSLVVREDSLTLYGFATDDERAMFELVQTSSGIGPKVALAILAVLDPDRLQSAIANGDVNTLTSVPGIGPKSAQRLIVDLKDRIGKVAQLHSPRADSEQQVVDALIGLGWSAKDSQKAVADVASESDDLSELLRLALRRLSS